VYEPQNFQLNEAQTKAFAEVQSFFKEEKNVLLHGVTSSGKTLIYIQSIKKMLEAGKQALVLIPEIALTTQLVERFKKHFGNQVAVYHSKFGSIELKSGKVFRMGMFPW
jgi:primosomal protein N' (replication factor Y) (superfamily II helicase)